MDYARKRMRRVATGLLLVMAVIVAALWWQSQRGSFAGFATPSMPTVITSGVMAVVGVVLFAWIAYELWKGSKEKKMQRIIKKWYGEDEPSPARSRASSRASSRSSAVDGTLDWSPNSKSK